MMKQNPISFSWKFNQQIGTLKKELERYGLIDSKTFAKLLEKVGISQFLIAQYFRMKNLASLDAPLQGHFATHSANTALVENVPDPATLDFAQKVTTEVQVTKILQEIFQEVQLSEREIEILTLRYGLNGQTAHNYKQIGKIFGITGERIRQIITAAERKIKTWLQEEHPEYIRIIQKSFFN
jgi:RNA polymerase primary sigma factor